RIGAVVVGLLILLGIVVVGMVVLNRSKGPVTKLPDRTKELDNQLTKSASTAREPNRGRISPKPAPASTFPPVGFEDPDHGTNLSSRGWPRVLVHGRDGARFPLIEGDSFLMGAFEESPKFGPHERPSQHIVLNDFYMQETEVTNGEFADFLTAGK